MRIDPFDVEALRKLGTELSYRFGVTVALALEEGAVVRFVIHDRGRMVDEYLSVPEYYGTLPPGDALALRANPTVVSRLTGAEPRARARTSRAPRTAATSCRRREELYAQLAELLGLAAVITLYDAARCPYCARVRIALAEKGIAYEPVEIDLSNRPAWLYEKNPTGRVPVLEEDTFVLPESVVIMEYLEERYPEPALLPADPRGAGARAAARAAVRRRSSAATTTRSAAATTTRCADAARGVRSAARTGFAAIAYLPWIIRARDMLGVELPRARRGVARRGLASGRPCARSSTSSRRCDDRASTSSPGGSTIRR